MMRWLQWSTLDLENVLGGVETHARCLARELRALGHFVEFSRDPRAILDPRWDVIQTHGSAIPLKRLGKPAQALRIHTLHGTTLGRMAACGEWVWPGGYYAAARENLGVIEADLVLTVHPDLWLAKLARKLGKPVVSCENGWDAFERPDELSPELLSRLPSSGSFWVFIGRGDDKVKAAPEMIRALELDATLTLAAAPGAGFESEPKVIGTGRLTPGQVLALLDRAAGLLIPSFYEGNSLSILEALSIGAPVVATRVGSAPLYADKTQGLVLIEASEARSILSGIERARELDLSREARRRRAEANRRVLPTWRSVAQTAVDSVMRLKAKNGSTEGES